MSPPPRAWQRMLSGRRLDLLNPSPLDVEIEDIAHGLARVARWNGQTKGAHAFSVAQHCLLATGDTYELLFTAPSSRHDDVVRLLAAQDLAGACIGRVTTSANRPAVRVLDAQSRLMNIESKGWDHFA